MSFTNKSQHLYSALFLIAILHVLSFCPLEATADGFTVDLFPRDSPLSPYYNSSNTHFHRLHDAFRRSLKRVNYFKSRFVPTSRIQAQMMPAVGEYLMKFSMGTPPVEVLGILDTASDLIWAQCKPCKSCYKQTPPLFDPHLSSTYQNIPCQSTSCNALQKKTCSGKKTCEYSYFYGDGSYTNGDLASDTLTMGNNQPASFPNIVFGCGHDNAGTYDKAGSGLIALGGGKLSLISQLGSSIGKKFSYCLVPAETEPTVPGKISFGKDAGSAHSSAVTTPMVLRDNFYYLSLEAISVGNRRIAYKGSTKAVADGQEGNIIIDSGTTFTLLPPEFLDGLMSALEKSISAPKAEDPKGVLRLCYKTTRDKINIPIITAHFKGADVKLPSINTFTSVKDDILCFIMIGSSDVPIYGVLSQMNFLVGYNLEASTVSFLPTDCTKQ